MNRAICRQFCVYFKPGKDEPGCRPVMLPLPPPEPGSSRTYRGIEPRLRDLICTACDYGADDGCDFHPAQAGPPCGGMAYLEHLLDGGRLTIEDIQRLCQTR